MPVDEVMNKIFPLLGEVWIFAGHNSLSNFAYAVPIFDTNCRRVYHQRTRVR